MLPAQQTPASQNPLPQLLAPAAVRKQARSNPSLTLNAIVPRLQARHNLQRAAQAQCGDRNLHRQETDDLSCIDRLMQNLIMGDQVHGISKGGTNIVSR